MRVNVSLHPLIWTRDPANMLQDPEIQKKTGKTDPVEVMAALREMKNNM